MIRPKKKRPACRRLYLREADELPRPDSFNEMVLGPNSSPRPPAVEREDGT